MQNYLPVIQRIRDDNAQIVYISGKTCTGKTTLANLIKDTFNCGVIELDVVVRKIDGGSESQKFVEAYRHRNDMKMVADFVSLAKSEINASLMKFPMVLFEGAVANNETLSEIVEDIQNFLFVYLLPVNLEVYKSRIMARFLESSPNNSNGLPASFWTHFNNSELVIFYKTNRITENLDHGIEKYATESMEEAKTRLATFSKTFSDIVVVEI